MNNQTTTESKEKICCALLNQVFIGGGYSTISLDNVLRDIPPAERAYITRLFYGVIEKSIQFDYIIKELTQKSPKNSVAILLKMGLYMLRYMDMPAYAAIDKTVTLSKEMGKSGVSGFINAFLRKSQDFKLPTNNLSVVLSYPKWVTDRLIKRYGEEFCTKMLVREDTPHRHIRHNSLKISKTDFDKKMAGAKRTPLGYVADAKKLQALKPNEYTVQSLSSMLAVKAYLSGEKFLKVLDICAAPGGKSLYLKELSPFSEVLCNDIHPHRVILIKKYAQRMGLELSYSCKDATLINPEWLEQFDLVICDVPCSGLGVKAKPDILLNRKEEDIAALSELQYAILYSAAHYVKKGGVLCYSTCTVFHEENEGVVERFLSAYGIDDNKNQSIDKRLCFKLTPIVDENIKDNTGMVNLYPAEFNSDGFFVSRLRRL